MFAWTVFILAELCKIFVDHNVTRFRLVFGAALRIKSSSLGLKYLRFFQSLINTHKIKLTLKHIGILEKIIIAMFVLVLVQLKVF
jgi:uncharacterized UPF0160 family protein